MWRRKKKQNRTALKPRLNPDCNRNFFFPLLTVHFFYFFFSTDYLDNFLASISLVTGKSKKKVDYTATHYLQYIIYIFILYIYIYITPAVIMTGYIHEHH